MIDHVGIYGSRVAEGLSAFNVGLVLYYSLLVKHHISGLVQGCGHFIVLALELS